MNRLMLLAVCFVSLATHSPKPVPMVKVLVVNQTPLSSYGLSEARDSLVVREARKQGVPTWLALSIATPRIGGATQRQLIRTQGRLV
ncbi:hypothetical protein LCGC14_2263370 [marine sediment metagenome]|uniref:Uncharacterized protein n=1 Tax=marine sediment metagenome TaxID=412755 RepID=A0A0F9DL83_9ZZZZ